MASLSYDAEMSAVSTYNSVHGHGDAQQQGEVTGNGSDDSSHDDDTSDSVAVLTGKRHCAPSPRRPEDNNQQEDDSSGRKEQEPSVASRHEQSAVVASGIDPHIAHGQQQQQQQPLPRREQQQTRANPETLEIARLRSENQTLAHKLRDLSTQYGRHVHSLQTQQQQQVVAHERAEKDWQRQVDALQRAHAEAVDDARRARAQTQVLEDRLAQAEPSPSVEPSTSNDSSNTSEHQQFVAPVQQPLRLTQQQSYFSSSSYQHPHTVHRSVVEAPHTNAPHVTCHTLSTRTEARTVRATRLGRHRSATPGSASSSVQLSPTGVTSMPPPANAFHWDEINYASYSGYPTPPPPAPVRVCSDAYYPTHSYAHDHHHHQQQPPVGYQRQQPSVVMPVSAPESLPSFSICSVSDDAAYAASQAHAQLEPIKPSSGLLAYCSELLTASRTTAAATAPTSSSNASPPPNAKVAPAWTFFSDSSEPPAQQTSLDVEQGYGPPRLHHFPHEHVCEQ